MEYYNVVSWLPIRPNRDRTVAKNDASNVYDCAKNWNTNYVWKILIPGIKMEIVCDGDVPYSYIGILRASLQR